MLKNVAADTNIIFYFMIAAGIIGVLSKIVNHLTLCRMVKAAGTMSKSRHKLMEQVRSEYGHACRTHGSVNHVSAFIRKYLYEYRGFLFRIHTWRQLEIQSIWFSGLLAALGAGSHYMAHGLCEGGFQYIAAGAAEMAVLFVISQITDEAYKIKGTEIYMADYLENVCANRYKKSEQTEKQTEKERIEVIRPKSVEASTPTSIHREQKPSFCAEAEPHNAQECTKTEQVIQHMIQDKSEKEEDSFSAKSEEAIRLILAEFLA